MHNSNSATGSSNYKDKKIIKVAIIGTGFGAKVILPAIISLDFVEVVALCGGADTRKTEEIAIKHNIKEYKMSYDELLSSYYLDVVFIASPHLFHYHMIKLAMQKGIHIIAEKPIALTNKQVDELANKSKNYDKICAVNHQLRFLDLFQRIKNYILDGAIGEPYFIRISYPSKRLIQPNIKWNWCFKPEEGGGLLLAVGSHLIDLLQYWFPGQIQSVSAYMSPVINLLHDKDDNLHEVLVESIFESRFIMDNGMVASLFSNGTSHRNSFIEINLYGTTGEIFFSSPNNAFIYKKNESGLIEEIDIHLDYEFSKEKSIWENSYSRFIETILTAISTNNLELLEGKITTFVDYANQFKIINGIKEAATKNIIFDFEQTIHKT